MNYCSVEVKITIRRPDGTIEIVEYRDYIDDSGVPHTISELADVATKRVLYAHLNH